MEPLRRILHVDDETDIRDVVALTLETIAGYKVESCESGTEALEKAIAFTHDLILLDIMMPGMDGPTTLQALRKNPQTASIPVVFVTAKVQPGDVSRYLELGALGVIVKPFGAKALCEHIQNYWAKHNGVS